VHGFRRGRRTLGHPRLPDRTVITVRPRDD
jgi:hypothetical protein